MTTQLHLSLLSEALIPSNLTPEPFDQYHATGHRHESTGHATFSIDMARS